jgi:ABC-2 type transport system ATP-binding protein
MTVLRFLRFAAELRHVPRARRASSVSEAVDRCGLIEVLHRQIRHLSKGFRQRLGLAQAILHRPDLLIFDEPTVGLDPRQVVEIRSIIRGLGESCTVLLSSHVLPEVTATCDRVIIINRGRLVAEGSLDELSADGGERLQVVLQRPGPAVAPALKGLPGITAVVADPDDPTLFRVTTDGSPDARTSLADQAVREGWGLRELSPMRSSLEEIFLRFVTEDEEAV